VKKSEDITSREAELRTSEIVLGKVGGVNGVVRQFCILTVMSLVLKVLPPI
jgi:hypothetical protein